MNKPTDFIILNPSPLNVRKADGMVTTLAWTADKPGYITVHTYLDAASRGLITVHKFGGNDLADAYGRTRVAYTINKD